MVENYRCADFAGSANRIGASVRLGRARLARSPGVACGHRVRRRRRFADRRCEPHVRTELRGRASSSTSATCPAVRTSCSSKWAATLGS